MTIAPPLLPRLFMELMAGPRERECLSGDLHEEFLWRVPHDGIRQARLWYARQVFLSLRPLVALAIRRGEWTGTLLTGCLAGALPLLALDRLWCLVYSLIPMKDGLHRAPLFYAINLFVYCGAVLIASQVRSKKAAAVISLFAAFALRSSVALIPAWYAASVLACAPLLFTLTAFHRRTS